MLVYVRYMYTARHVVLSNCRPHILKFGYTADCYKQGISKLQTKMHLKPRIILVIVLLDVIRIIL